MHESNERAAQPAFIRPGDVAGITRTAEHGGTGEILFRRLLERSAFASAVDFVDLSVIPPGSKIGRHEHVGTEEMYFIVAGEPLMSVGGECRRLRKGDLSVVRSGQWHELMNDTQEPVEIFVVQVSL